MGGFGGRRVKGGMLRSNYNLKNNKNIKRGMFSMEV